LVDVAQIQRINTVRQWLSFVSTGLVLDLGCGYGITMISLRNSWKSGMIGVDISIEDLQLAKQFNKRAEFLRGSATHLPFRGETFRGLVMTEVLEHLTNDTQAAHEAFRVLRPNGHAIFTVPSSNYPFLWDPLNGALRRLSCQPIRKGLIAGIWRKHLRLYRMDSLYRLLNVSGFRVQRMRGLTGIVFPFAGNLTSVSRILSPLMRPAVSVLDKLNQRNQNKHFVNIAALAQKEESRRT